MFPSRINSSGSPPPASINNGENANASPPSQGLSQSTQSREKPRTLDDLPGHRQILSSSPRLAAQRLGEALGELHRQFAHNEITSDDHRDQCYKILQAAEKVMDPQSVVDDDDREQLARLDLHDITRGAGALSEPEYVAIADDLSVQLHSERGIEAVRTRAEIQQAGGQELPLAMAGRLLQLETMLAQAGVSDQAMAIVRAHPHEAAAAFGLTTGATAGPLRTSPMFDETEPRLIRFGTTVISQPRDVAASQHAAATAPDRVSASALLAARDLVHSEGRSVDDAMRMFGIQHPEDVATLQREAGAGPYRVRETRLLAAGDFIREGRSVADAIDMFSIRHPDDLAVLDRAAAEAATRRQ